MLVGLTPSEGEAKTQYIRYGWAMREAAISIMQMRTCTVAHRLIVIAMMLYDIVELHDGGRADDIPETIDYYLAGTYGERFMAEFNDIEPNEEISLKMNTQMYFIFMQRAGAALYPVFAELMGNFNRHKEEIGATVFEEGGGKDYYVFYAYITQLMSQHWGDFLARWEHVLENYLVNFMFSEVFPLKYHHKGLNPYHHLFILVEQYVLAKMLLCGNYNHEEGFSKQYITRVISEVAQLNQHSTDPLSIAENYRNAGVDCPAHLYYLVI